MRWSLPISSLSVDGMGAGQRGRKGRIRDGDGSPLTPLRWWDLVFRSLFVIRIGEAEFELTAAGSSLTGAQHLVNGNQSVSGDQQVAGNIEAGGTIMDGAGNSNNHTH